ncbi:hypothetical protein Taiwan878_14470 [Helicobacter pylori]
MDLTNLENALNSGNFKELLKNFREHDLEIVGKIKAIKSALAGFYEILK